MEKPRLHVHFNGYTANMKFFIFLLLLLVEGSFGYRVVCVYTNWSQYRPDGGKFLPEDVDPTLCTHLIYVYAKLKGNRLEPTEWNDDGSAWSEGMYERVNNLKQINPDLKTLLGVGGWMMGSKDFSKLAASRTSRRIFAKTSVKFLRDRNFDGLTIDWQHPTKRGGKPRDKVNFSLFLKEIRQAFEADSTKSGLPPLLLTTGVSASREIIGAAYEIENITKYTDFINVMAYDLHGAWDNYTGHPSQLYAREEEFGPSTEINVDASMRYWMSNVQDRSKLVLGVSTYGRTFTLRKARHNDYNVPTTGPGVAGEFTQQPGMLAYYERCSQYPDAPRVWDVFSQVAYWYSGDQWIAGEDVESVKAKVNWTRTFDIGGLMVWSLDTDDFADICQTQGYPLLNTAVTELNDPSFVKPNISVERRRKKVDTITTTEPSTFKMKSSISLPRTPKALVTLDSSVNESSNIISMTTSTSKSPTKKTIVTIKKKQQRQQIPLLDKRLRSKKKIPQTRPQRNLKTPQRGKRVKQNNQIRPVGKMKVRRRFNPKLRRKALLRKLKNRNIKNKNNKIAPNMALRNKKEVLKNTDDTKKNETSSVVIEKHTSKVITEKASIENTAGDGKGVKTVRKNTGPQSDKRDSTDLVETGKIHGRNKTSPLLVTAKTAMVSKRKQTVIHILPRNNKVITKSTIANEISPKTNKNNTPSDKMSEISKISDSIRTNNKVTNQTLSITTSVNRLSNRSRSKQTDPMIQSTAVSTVTKSNENRSKEFQTQSQKKIKRRRGKLLKNGKRLKRRRKKGPREGPAAKKRAV